MTEIEETIKYLDRIRDSRAGTTWFIPTKMPVLGRYDMTWCNVALVGDRFRFNKEDETFSGFELLEELARMSDYLAKQLSEPIK